MPPLRMSILDYLLENSTSELVAIHDGTNKPRSTVKRQVEALHALGVVVTEVDVDDDGRKSMGYGIDSSIDMNVLRLSAPSL